MELVPDGELRRTLLVDLGYAARTPAQVLLRWCLEREIPVIPKSTHRDRIAENAQVFDFKLTDEDMARLDELDRTGGTDRAIEQKRW